MAPAIIQGRADQKIRCPDSTSTSSPGRAGVFATSRKPASFHVSRWESARTPKRPFRQMWARLAANSRAGSSGIPFDRRQALSREVQFFHHGCFEVAVGFHANHADQHISGGELAKDAARTPESRAGGLGSAELRTGRGQGGDAFAGVLRTLFLPDGEVPSAIDYGKRKVADPWVQPSKPGLRYGESHHGGGTPLATEVVVESLQRLVARFCVTHPVFDQCAIEAPYITRDIIPKESGISSAHVRTRLLTSRYRHSNSGALGCEIGRRVAGTAKGQAPETALTCLVRRSDPDWRRAGPRGASTPWPSWTARATSGMDQTSWGMAWNKA